jgi:hypothetical protein
MAMSEDDNSELLSEYTDLCRHQVAGGLDSHELARMEEVRLELLRCMNKS